MSKLVQPLNRPLLPSRSRLATSRRSRANATTRHNTLRNCFTVVSCQFARLRLRGQGQGEGEGEGGGKGEREDEREGWGRG